MTSEVTAWLVPRIPAGWFAGPPGVHVDREEIVVVGPLSSPVRPSGSGDAHHAACLDAVTAFREETRAARVAVAEEAERRFGRKVSWGVELEGERYLFTHAAVPVMTRLRFAERGVLDTLIDAGVARSRSEALAWCVRLVERNQEDWIGQLRSALDHVAAARRAGPEV